MSPAEGEAIGFAYLLEHAAGNERALRELNSINMPEPYLTIDDGCSWYEKIKIQRTWLITFGGEFYGRSDYSLLFNYRTILAPEYTLLDFLNFGRGSVYSLKSMWPQVMRLNLEKEAASLEVPVFFLQGRHDFNTPSILVERYFRTLAAPVKELIWFENSGHHPMYEEPEKFRDALITRVLPLCR